MSNKEMTTESALKCAYTYHCWFIPLLDMV